VNKQEKRDLFSDFEPVDRKQWEEQIKKDLKGADYKKTLQWNTLEGLNILPFYMSEDIDPTQLVSISSLREAKSEEWERCEPITAHSPRDANAQIKDAVNGGANAFSIHSDISYSDGEIGGNMMGTQIQSQSDFNKLFDGVDLSDKTLLFDSGMNTPAVQAMLTNLDTQPKKSLFAFDPFTYAARHGREPITTEKLDHLINQVQSATSGKSLLADGVFYHHSGATIVQELGIALSIASEYLARSNSDRLTDTASSIFFRLSSGPLYFPEIAKFRALRILWANLLSGYDLDPEIQAFIHTETSLQNQTVADPQNNILRATTEAMAAIVGGTDSLLIHTHDKLFNEQNSFSSRIARNIHHIIGEESHLGDVADPASGSYYIEELTNQIADEAWEFFKLIETQGGFLKALKNRVIQPKINESKSKKLEAYATRKRTLVGTNNYPASDDSLPESVIPGPYTDALEDSGNSFEVNSDRLITSMAEAFKNSAYVGDLYQAYLSPQKVLYTSLEPFRAGEIFEQIRRRTEDLKRKPVVQLIPTGNTKWRKLRETFAQNLFGCAGFEIKTSNGYDSIETASKELTDEPGDIYVLCSSDADYPELIGLFSKHFSNKGILVLAGKPGDRTDEYQKAGIDHFIYSGQNIPEFLKAIQDELEHSKQSS